MCGVFLFRFSQDRVIQDWICLNWIFPFRFRLPGLLQDGVLNRPKLPVGVPDTLPDHIALFLQLPHPGADTVHAILADTGKALCGIVPSFRQGKLRYRSVLHAARGPLHGNGHHAPGLQTARQAQISFTSTRLSDGTTSTVTVAVDQDGAIVTLDATIAEFIAAEENPNISYRLQGMVKEIQNNTWGNIVIEDVSGEVLVYGLLTEEGGESQQFASLGIKVGDVVTLVGKRDSYKDTPQVGDAYYESHYSPVTATVAEFLAAAESSDVWYRLTGTIENLSNTEYGNFNIVDATGSVYVYGLLTGLNGEKKQFASLGLAEGDNITLIGNRAAYKGDPQVGNAYFVSKNN